jgi:hypothetical protein
MKVRLTAEEYSEHASLCARTPARRAPLLRRSLGLPLAGSPRNGPRDSLRLCRESVQPVVACAEPPRQSCASARAARAFGETFPSEGSFVRSKHRARLPSRSATRGQCEDSRFGIRYDEASGSIAAAQELAASVACAHAHPAAEPAATEPTGAPSTADPAPVPVPVPASAPSAGHQVGG